MDLEQKAIERIRTASEMSLNYYKKHLVCTYSGGKDSDVMLELFRRSGVPFEVHHSHTTVDAPQCEISMPKLTMWQLQEERQNGKTVKMCLCGGWKIKTYPDR